MAVSNRLEAIMIEKQKSTWDICFLTGLTYLTVLNARKGKNVTLQTARLIANALDVNTLDDIWPLKEKEVAA
jgi:DNA-binding Xre family transcriptional regulator